MSDIHTPIGDLRPYHVYPLIIYLRDHHRELDDDTRRALMAHVAMHSPDASAAAALADITDDGWGALYPREAAQTPGTVATIDKFIQTYGHTSEEEDALLERLILNPTPDYGAVLADEDKTSGEGAAVADATSAGIDNFLAAHGGVPSTVAEASAEPAVSTEPAAEPPVAPATAPAAEPVTAPATAPAIDSTKKDDTTAKPKKAAKEPTPASSLSESLAKIYIKQGRYRRAYEILSDLNLKNPEKSIYFADQLRFLRKVISLLPPEQEGAAKGE